MKSVQIRIYLWSVFSCIRTEYGQEITPYLDIFHEVSLNVCLDLLELYKNKTPSDLIIGTA